MTEHAQCLAWAALEFSDAVQCAVLGTSKEQRRTHQARRPSQAVQLLQLLCIRSCCGSLYTLTRACEKITWWSRLAGDCGRPQMLHFLQAGGHLQPLHLSLQVNHINGLGTS